VPEPYRKHSHKGKKCRRGFGVHYEQKKQNINITLTPDAIAQLEDQARSEGCSRSETIERWLRGQMPPTSIAAAIQIGRNQVFERSPQAIKSPDDDRVPFSGKFKRFLQTRAIGFRPAHLVRGDFFTPCGLQRIMLQA